MNRNKVEYLKFLLESSGDSNLSFEFKTPCYLTATRSIVEVSLNDIAVVKQGQKEIFNCSKWRSAPHYVASFQYYKPRDYTTVSRGSNIVTHIYNSPTYSITIIDNDKKKTIVQKDFYEIVKSKMNGKNFTGKKRKKFEMEFYKLIDNCEKLDLDLLVTRAIRNSGI